ncbi:MAG: hypothetical protein K2X93_28930 [Candidatus Obscuribacterales bacterium]|nr:hypothetical protein [Candidatus Obscuribacterales bacterium]
MSKSKRKLKKSSPQPSPSQSSLRSGEKLPYVNPDEPHSYQRSNWKHFIRYPAVCMLGLLNVALVMSFLERLPKHQTMDPFKEGFFFLFVLFIDLFWLVPMILEVNKVQTDSKGVRVSTLFWKSQFSWDKILRFEQPRFLKFAVVRTARCFYLINKYDLKPYYELAAIIEAKMPSEIEDSDS